MSPPGQRVLQQRLNSSAALNSTLSIQGQGEDLKNEVIGRNKHTLNYFLRRVKICRKLLFCLFLLRLVESSVEPIGKKMTMLKDRGKKLEAARNKD